MNLEGYTDEQIQNIVDNLDQINKNIREELKELPKLQAEQHEWITEKGNIYMDLGELERILFSKDSPSVKVSECKRVIKKLNDPFHLQENIG